jgi:hypothetical protein
MSNVKAIYNHSTKEGKHHWLFWFPASTFFLLFAVQFLFLSFLFGAKFVLAKVLLILRGM